MNAFLHWLHLVAAIAWIGGMIFASLILQPVLRKRMTSNERFPFYSDMGKKFKALQLHCFIILILTGLYKLRHFFATPTHLWNSSFGRIVIIKLILISIVAVLSSLHSYSWGPRLSTLADEAQSRQFKALAGKMTLWGRVNLAMALLIILCGALLHFPP